MAFLKDLGKVKLKAATTNDKSGPKVSGYVTQEEIAQTVQHVQEANIEKWLDALKTETFDTKFVELTKTEARGLLKAKSIDSIEQLENFLKNDSVMVKLENKIQKEIDEWTSEEKENPGVFAKLSSRSAKDVSDKDPRLLDKVQAHLYTLKERDMNAKLWSLITVTTEALCVKDAHTIIRMFSQSDRISEDLESAFTVNDWNENVVLRKWVPIDVDMEFRGFVKNGRLNALSQYNYVLLSPRLHKLKDELAANIIKYWESNCKDKLEEIYPKGGYVIDFAVLRDRKVLVIEVNPFAETTDGGLFSWKKERKILEEGPFEFRLTGEVFKDINVLPFVFRDLLKSLK